MAGLARPDAMAARIDCVAHISNKPGRPASDAEERGNRKPGSAAMEEKATDLTKTVHSSLLLGRKKARLPVGAPAIAHAIWSLLLWGVVAQKAASHHRRRRRTRSVAARAPRTRPHHETTSGGFSRWLNLTYTGICLERVALGQWEWG